MAAITLPIVTTYNDKGVKGAQGSLKDLVGSQLGAALSAGALVQQLGKAVTAFSEDEAAAKQLKIAVQNSTGATDEQVVSLEAQIKKMESASGVADDQLRPSLTTLVRATKDVAQAQDLLTLALDISAGSGRDLESVSLALAKASDGNFGALKRLGVKLDESAVKTKDFDTIQRQLALSFEGASAAAAASTAGGMKKFGIAIDNLYEAVGAKLAPTLTDLTNIFLKVVPAATDKASGGGKTFIGTLVSMTTNALPLTGSLKLLAKLLHLAGGEAESVSKTITHTSAEFALMDQLLTSRYNESLKKSAKELAELRKKQEAARKVAKDHADTLRDRVVTAVDEVAKHLQDAKDQMQGFADATSDSITGMVSLSDAIKTQDEAAKGVADALQNRKDAYADVAKATKDVDDAMAKLIKTQKGDDPEAVISATEDLADAKIKLKDANDALALSETAVNTAQTVQKESTYAKAFQKQLADAKQFAANLQYLVGYGLSKDGLAQLINLGPTAGLEVTADLINGAKGFTLADLNQGLASLSTSAAGLGLAAGNAFFGGNVANANAAMGTVNNLQITVNSGLVSNPATVGRDIIEAILAAERLSGQVFVTI